jgi:hypothetical protein
MSNSTYPVFTTAAVRDASIPFLHPSQGDTCVISTGTDAGLYTYAGPITGWCPPWNQPWGEQVYLERTTNIQVGDFVESPADVGLSVYFSPTLNRKYVARFKGTFLTDLVNDAIDVKITLQSDEGADYMITTCISRGDAFGLGTKTPHAFTWKVPQLTTRTPHHFSVLARQSTPEVALAGSLIASPANPAYFTLRDTGPSGPPV